MIKIVTARWQEPEEGSYTTEMDLPESGWGLVNAVIRWVSEYWPAHGDPEAVGTTIIKYKVADHKSGRLKKVEPTSPTSVLEDMALQLRYSSGEGLYEEDCPIFKANGIERS